MFRRLYMLRHKSRLKNQTIASWRNFPPSKMNIYKCLILTKIIRSPVTISSKIQIWICHVVRQEFHKKETIYNPSSRCVRPFLETVPLCFIPTTVNWGTLWSSSSFRKSAASAPIRWEISCCTRLIIRRRTTLETDTSEKQTREMDPWHPPDRLDKLPLSIKGKEVWSVWHEMAS